jgi:hypothetical protein
MELQKATNLLAFQLHKSIDLLRLHLQNWADLVVLFRFIIAFAR